MITIYLYNFSKRKNSTKQPSSGTAFTGDIKENSSVLSPTIRLLNANPTGFNYMYIPDFGRYYYISDISYALGTWEVRGQVDVLATYKTQIKNTTAFVIYDTTDNTEIIDTRLSQKTTKVSTMNTKFFSEIGKGVTAIIGVTGKESTDFFAITVGQARNLFNSVNDWLTQVLPDNPGWDWQPGMSVEDTLRTLTDTMVDGFNAVTHAGKNLIATGSVGDSIRGCWLAPIPIYSFSGSPQEIYLGQYPSGVYGYLINESFYIEDSLSLDIPWTFNDWRRNNPYTRLYVYSKYFGKIEIPSSAVIGDSSINVEIHFHPSSGDAIITVRSTRQILASFNVNFNCPYAIGSSNMSPYQAANAIFEGVTSTIGGALTGGLAGAGATGAKSLAGIFTSMVGTPNTIGNGGGGAVIGVIGSVSIYEITHDTNVEPNSVRNTIGLPTFASKSLSNLSGYVETACASVSITGFDSEAKQINDFLNGGIFIE